jgi:hypothetical protein
VNICLIWPDLRYYPGIQLEKLRQFMKNLRQGSWSLGQYMNSGPPKYNAGVLTSQQWCSVGFSKLYTDISFENGQEKKKI